MSTNKDFKVKNGIQPTVYHEGLGTVVSGSVGSNLSGASYDSVSFNVLSQDNNPYGVVFNNDGTKMYMAGEDTTSVYQYSLSTAFDLSTASYDSVSFSVASQDTFLRDVAFNNDGTKMYILGVSNDSVYQYSLSTAFDLSTASYDSVSFSVTSQDTTPLDMVFNTDGTKLYIVGSANDTIYQYSLSTSFDLSTASYDSVSFSVASQDGRPYGAAFNSDGTKMYMVGRDSSSVHQYTLSTAFDLSTASYDSVSFSVASQDANPYGVVFNNDITKMYIVAPVSRTIYQYSTVLNTAELDLSTGSVFEVTPTSDIQVTLSNPADSGTVSGATLLLEGAESTGVATTFSTTLYTGTSPSTQTITNNINLSGDGGLVWLKSRTEAQGHSLFDTERGANELLQSESTSASQTVSNRGVTAFNSNGFDLGGGTGGNRVSNDYVSWTFKKQAKFFDVVTYTGDGVAGRSISHSLNSDVGTILFKRTDSTSNWIVWHRSAGGAYGFLDAADAFTADSGISNPTTTAFTIESTINAGWNASGGTYVAYLFAHDTDASSLIKCGSYTGNGSTTGTVVNLGFEPQWVMVKSASITADWTMYDNVRGVEAGTTGSKYLHANKVDAEATRGFNFLSNGFQPRNTGTDSNSNGATYIYIAIRNPYIPTITYDPTLEWPGGTAPTAPANGETDVVTFNTRDGGSTYQGVLAIDGAK